MVIISKQQKKVLENTHNKFTIVNNIYADIYKSEIKLLDILEVRPSKKVT